MQAPEHHTQFTSRIIITRSNTMSRSIVTVSAATQMTESLKRATRVLKLVRIAKEDAAAERVGVYPFRNGREHGYVIQCWAGSVTRWFMFAQHRNSDGLVLYNGAGYIDNVPSEVSYKAAEFFGAEAKTEREAEAQLAQHLTKAIAKVLRNAYTK